MEEDINEHIKKKTWILFCSIFLLVFLVGTVSGFEFDNVQSYSENEKEYLIENALGIPFFGKEIARIKLDTPLNFLVPRGYQKVAEFTVENYDDYINVFNDMEFYDLNKDSEGFVRDFDYKYKTIVQVPDYKTVCDEKLNVNGTIEYSNCRQEQIGFKDKIVWEEINKVDGLLKGNITVGIFTDVKKGDKVEWIPTLFGERLTEWAVWVENNNVGLVAYYKLDEASGTVIDEIGNHDGANSGATPDIIGQINKSYLFDEAENDVINIGDTLAFPAMNEVTLSMWGNWTTKGDRRGVALRENNDVVIGAETTEGLSLSMGATIIGIGGAANYNVNQWYHLVATLNGTTAKIYVNGSLIESVEIATPGGATSDDVIGALNLIPQQDMDGLIDEVFIANRSWSDSEISDLYDAQKDGFINGSYTNVFPPTITLNSPINGFNTTNQTINFNGTVVSIMEVTNVTLFIDGVLNETNSSGINDTDYLFTKTISDGSHNWTYESCNTDGDCVTATIRTFTIASFFENTPTFNASSFETAQERLTVNITTNGSVPANGKLIYKNVEYSSATITNTFGNDYNISRTISIPAAIGTNNWSFNFTLAGSERNTLTQSQIINASNFTYCGAAPLNIPYLNFSFKDEGDDSVLNASNDLTDVDFWLGDGTVTKNYITSNSTDKFNYTFCFNPQDRTVTVDMAFKYSASGYPLRTFAFDDQALTNTTAEQTLYLLATADGIYSSISIIEASGNTIEGVKVIIERQFSGVWTTVGLDNTGSDGVVTFWVNPNFQHRITATKTGYVTTQVTITPSQSLYTLTLQKTTGEATYTSPLEGIKWVVYPASGTIAPGSRSFNATVTSSESNLENCKFELVNATNLTHSVASITSFTNSSYCFLDITYSSTVDNNFFGRLSLDTTNTTGFVIVNADWKWIIIDITDVKAWRSITSFFSDLKTIGEFGEGNEAEFSRIVVFFILMTLGLGVLIYFTGIELASPGITIAIIWVIVLFASVGGFLTFESGSSNVNERIEQYGFFFILTLYVINYFLTIIRRANE